MMVLMVYNGDSERKPDIAYIYFLRSIKGIKRCECFVVTGVRCEGRRVIKSLYYKSRYFRQASAKV